MSACDRAEFGTFTYNPPSTLIICLDFGCFVTPVNRVTITLFVCCCGITCWPHSGQVISLPVLAKLLLLLELLSGLKLLEGSYSSSFIDNNSVPQFGHDWLVTSCSTSSYLATSTVPYFSFSSV